MEEGQNQIFPPGRKPDTLIEHENRWEVFSPVSLLILCTMSVLFIRSAQAYTGGNQWEMQVVWVLLGFLIYIVVSLVDYHFWMRFAHITYAIGLASLFLVFICYDMTISSKQRNKIILESNISLAAHLIKCFVVTSVQQ